MADEQAPAPPPASFGEEMRTQREIRGISLKEIADSTKISKRYLEAIERDDYKTLPAPVFTRGFVREYARYLGLNPDEAVSRYLHYRQLKEQTGQVSREPRQPVRDVSREPLREMRHATARESLRKIQNAAEQPPSPSTRSYRGLGAFVVLLLVFLGAVYALQNRSLWKRELPPQPGGTTNETVARVLAPPAAVEPPPAADMVMRVRAIENTWVALEADGRSVFNSELRKGEEQTFRARDRFVFKTVGNAGGIEVQLNGVAVPSLGSRGEVVRDKVFDRQSVIRQEP